MAELIWQGKYKDGGRAASPRPALPLCTVERAGPDASPLAPDPSSNRLIWGDTAYLLPSLLPEFAARVDLVYIDPPFHTGGDFSMTTPVPAAGPARRSNTVRHHAYRDSWGGDLDGYLQWFYGTVVLLRDLLAPHGAIFVHLDWHVEDYARVIMDEVFGRANFRNKICWAYRSGGASRRGSLARKHDAILFYAKSPAFKVRPQIERHYLSRPFMGSQRDAQGRYYVDTLLRDVLEGQIVTVSGDATIAHNLRPVLNLARERIGYPTQKPLGLLQLLLGIASDPGDLVLDCFCGSGTTALAADATGRRWIACDQASLAIQTTRKRLLALSTPPPFVVQDLGVAGRRAWHASAFGPAAHQGDPQEAYRRHILARYGAQPFSGYTWLHGQSPTGFVHVAPIDAPLTAAAIAGIRADLQSSAQAARGVDVLCWGFEPQCPELCRQVARSAGVEITLRYIPPDIMHGGATQQSRLAFDQPPQLCLQATHHGCTVRLDLTGYTLSPDHIPAARHPVITHWSQWIDYWAIDWDYRHGIFSHGWFTHRARPSRPLLTGATHDYARPGAYIVAVMAVDILGHLTIQQFTITVAG